MLAALLLAAATPAQTSIDAERAFAAGAGTSFDLVDAGRNERNAELDLTVKEFEVIKARIAALLATANCNY